MQELTIVSTVQAGEDNLFAWRCGGKKALHLLSLGISERCSLGCSCSAITETPPSS